MFARDFHELLDRALKDAAVSFGKTFDVDDKNKVPADGGSKVSEAEFEPLSFPELDEKS